MRKVLNTAQYGVHVVLGGEQFRFSARELKPLPARLVETDEFKQYSTLVNMGIHRDSNTETEIKSHEPEVSTTAPEVENASVVLEPNANVVDDKSTEVQVVEDIEVEEKPKPKRKRKTTTKTTDK